MPLRIVIFGPGRVGIACGRRLSAAGADVLGFVGRDPARAAAAVEAAGTGPVLTPADHGRAHVVLFAVGDADLRGAIAQAAAAAAPRACSLWLHTSGRHGLEVFDGLAGPRRGALHPVAPFGDAASGEAAMVGAPGVYLAEPRAQRLLVRLCGMLGLVPVAAAPGDRELYHAACALAANGLTALLAGAQTALQASGVVGESSARQLVVALMRSAIAGAAERGPVAALSGPVRRGDAETVAAHLEALRGKVPSVLPAYEATAQLALQLAATAGLDATLVAAVRRVLTR